MIETQAGAYVPRAAAHLILNVKGGLDVPLASREIQIQLCAGIELRGVGYVVLQRFVNRSEEGVGAGFPVVMAAVAGDVAADVAFAITAVLIDDYGSGERIGTKGKAGVADAAGKAEKEVGRNRMLKIDLAAGFRARGVL